MEDNEFDDLETQRFTKRYRAFESRPPVPLTDIEKTEQNLRELTPKPEHKYVHEGVIAYGGMKLISRLRDRDSLRDVAHATLLNADADMVTMGRFIREARITANLEHPNIIPIHDMGIEGGVPYFTMKLIDGDTLMDIIDGLRKKNEPYVKKYTLSERLRIFRHMLNAILFAHTKGVIHLDLSPGNVLVGRHGEVLVLDWGLAKVMGVPSGFRTDHTDGKEAMHSRLDGTPQTQVNDGIAQGTPGYMAPEQASGQNTALDIRTDIYSLGASLYAILTLESPIPGRSLREVLANTVAGNFVPPRKRAKHYIPSSLNAVVMKAMATKPEDRYQNVRAFRDDIDAFLDGRATLAERATIFKHAMLFLRRNFLPVALTLLLVLTIGGYGIYQMLNDYMALWHWGRPVYEIDYRTDLSGDTPSLIFTDSANQLLTDPFVFDAQGYRIPAGHSIWLPVQRPFNDGRAVFRIRTDRLDFDIFWGASNVSFRQAEDAPPGTMIRFRDGTIAVSNNRFSGRPVPYDEKLFPNRTLEEPTEFVITVQSINGVISVFVNNALALKANDAFPLPATRPAVGLRAGSAPLHLCSAALRPASPDAALGQFALPEMLVWRHATEEAAKQYVSVAKETGDASVAQRAMVRAMYLVLYRMPEFPNPEAALDSIREQFPLKTPQFVEDQYYMVKAEILWRNGDFADAFRMLRLVTDPTGRQRAARNLAGYDYALPPETTRQLERFVTGEEI